MSRFTAQLSAQTTSLSEDASISHFDPAGKMVSATPGIAAGAAVVGSAVVAYAVEEANDN